VRFALLGYWPRFSIYYAPLVLLLAVYGFASLASSLGRRAPLAAAAGLVLLAFWCDGQTRAVLPTLAAFHRATAPVESALRYARDRYEPEETLVISDYALLGRHAEYYAPRYGLAYAKESELQPAQIKAVRHILKLQVDPVARAGASWSSDVTPLGTWMENVPRWREFSPAAGAWQASLFELRGALAVFRNWRKEEDARRGTVRYPRATGSSITVLHAPASGFDLRLKLASVPGAAYEATIVINGARRIDWHGASDAIVRVSPAEASPRAIIELFSPCGADGRCFPVTGYEVTAALNDGAPS
jgi:hypothetical protein